MACTSLRLFGANKMRCKACNYMLGAVLAGILAGPARADMIYTYTGNDFTSVTSPYVKSDFISGVLDFQTALGPNFAFQEVSPASFTFTGGVAGDTLTNLNSSGAFFAATDGYGNLDGWYMVTTSNTDPNAHVQLQNTPYDGTQLDFFTNTNADGYNQFAAGQWVASVSTVPEPSTLILMIAAVTGLWGVRRRWTSAARPGVALAT